MDYNPKSRNNLLEITGKLNIQNHWSIRVSILFWLQLHTWPPETENTEKWGHYNDTYVELPASPVRVPFCISGQQIWSIGEIRHNARYRKEVTPHEPRRNSPPFIRPHRSHRSSLLRHLVTNNSIVRSSSAFLVNSDPEGIFLATDPVNRRNRTIRKPLTGGVPQGRNRIHSILGLLMLWIQNRKP